MLWRMQLGNPIARISSARARGALLLTPVAKNKARLPQNPRRQRFVAILRSLGMPVR